MYLIDGGEVIGLMTRIAQRERVAQRDPEASQALQNDATFGIGNALERLVALGCFAPRVQQYHRSALRI